MSEIILVTVGLVSMLGITVLFAKIMINTTKYANNKK